MLTVFAYSTPNSIKVPIALEEAGLAYDLRRNNVRAGAQKAPESQTLNPNRKVPRSWSTAMGQTDADDGGVSALADAKLVPQHLKRGGISRQHQRPGHARQLRIHQPAAPPIVGLRPHPRWSDAFCPS